MSAETLLLEIGCEEIPARMIRRAGNDLGARVVEILDKAGLSHGASTVWAGPRRLAVRVDSVVGRQEDRDELLLGPPASVAFDDSGQPTKAALGFAKKQGVEPAKLERRTTDKGEYLAVQRSVTGQGVGELLAEQLPRAVSGMSFPKTMRWADGSRRWVRPVHWVVALHGSAVLPVELFGVEAGGTSIGHRFLSQGAVPLGHADRYLEALEQAHVVADPAIRRRRLSEAMTAAAKARDAEVVEDEALLDEVAELVEWPGTVAGSFNEDYLSLPPELLVTTLRHHQKCFSLQDGKGKLRPEFVAVANTDRDPGSHIRRGNEWVIGGRLEDARFFWGEDRKRSLAERAPELSGVVFHAKVGSYAEKAERVAAIGDKLALLVGVDEAGIAAIREASLLAKVDLVTGTVGEFPELQGKAGGLMLAAEGRPESVWRGVYEHYQPAGAADALPASVSGCVVSVADKLETIASMFAAGQAPTGSRDPFGLRRASVGLFRTLIDRDWPVSLKSLVELAGAGDDLLPFLHDRFRKLMRDSGYTPNEVDAVFRPKVSAEDGLQWPLADIARRLQAIQTVRPREDFVQLVDLTKRVDNILTKGVKQFAKAEKEVGDGPSYEEQSEAARALAALVSEHSAEMGDLEQKGSYSEAVDLLGRFVEPVERFFEEVLVLDDSQPRAMLHRRKLLAELRSVLTRCFDIRELAGQADRS